MHAALMASRDAAAVSEETGWWTPASAFALLGHIDHLDLEPERPAIFGLTGQRAMRPVEVADQPRLLALLCSHRSGQPRWTRHSRPSTRTDTRRARSPSMLGGGNGQDLPHPRPRDCPRASARSSSGVTCSNSVRAISQARRGRHRSDDRPAGLLGMPDVLRCLGQITVVIDHDWQSSVIPVWLSGKSRILHHTTPRIIDCRSS